jgi:hypothetical protein
MMKTAAVALALTFAAGMALGCPADSAGMDAKAEASMAAAAPAKTPQVKAVVDKKAVKPAEDKKVTAEVKQPSS